MFGKVDLSRKGSVDAPIFDFLNNLNSHQDYVSLSSCSGRIIIFISGENVKKVCSTTLTNISFNCLHTYVNTHLDELVYLYRNT